MIGAAPGRVRAAGIERPEAESPTMDMAYVSALSALAGSVVGGVTTGMTAWFAGRAQARAARVDHQLMRRQDLYKEFIAAASNVYGEALVSSEPQLQELVALYGMIGRMRVLCAPRTVAAAERIMVATIEAFHAPNKTMIEVRDLIRSGTALDPLREFSEAARQELLSVSRMI
jgi:hypothetical protein